MEDHTTATWCGCDLTSPEVQQQHHHPHLGCDRNITLYQGYQHVVANIYGIDRHLAGTGADHFKTSWRLDLCLVRPITCSCHVCGNAITAYSNVECSSWEQYHRHCWHGILYFLGLPFRSPDFATRPYLGFINRPSAFAV